jgi:hypothetical protein
MVFQSLHSKQNQRNYSTFLIPKGGGKSPPCIENEVLGGQWFLATTPKLWAKVPPKKILVEYLIPIYLILELLLPLGINAIG